VTDRSAGFPGEFPDGFFDRADVDDAAFYVPPRLVTHIDAGAIEAVGQLYRELAIDGTAPAPVRVLDLMSSWVSHFLRAPGELVVLGMNAAELDRNPMATERVVHDLNDQPEMPFPDGRFDAVTCCVSVDYLCRPIEVFADVARVLVPGGLFVTTFSNRCFQSKVIRGWLATDDAAHCAIVAEYFRRSGGWDEPVVDRRTPPGWRGDPLYAVWARTAGPLHPDVAR
jgi:SAM-dependent methyltransferase